MGVTKLDITLSARTARHLYLATAIVFPILIILGLLLAFTFFQEGADRHIAARIVGWLIVLIIALSVIAGPLFALYRARRELNGWAYFTAALCALLLLAISVGYLFLEAYIQVNIVPAENAQSIIQDQIPQDWIPSFGSYMAVSIIAVVMSIYTVHVLIDFGRLALSRYDTLNVTPLQLANSVSRFLRNKRSPVSMIHKPSDPVRTCVYATLCVLSSFVPPYSILGLGQYTFLISTLPLIAAAAMTRRHYALRADRIFESDTRRPIIFLRSFADDRVWLWGRGFLGKYRRRTIDEAIVRFAERLGPFVAIANPNTKLPRLGAAQTYFSNDTWQSAIARWLEMAQMIIVVAGRTEGIRWELDHIFSNENYPKRLVIFFPPGLREDPAAAARWLDEHFSHTRYGAELSAMDPTRVIAVSFRDDGLFVVETSQIYQHEVDYFVAFQAIIFATAA